MDEKQQFFVDAGQVDDADELMDELNELEAEMAEDELSGLEIGTGAVSNGQQQKQPAQHVENKANKNEEDELKALEQMMA